MNAERWKQIDELFDAVLEIPNARREDFLSENCNGDDDLKREVLSLLKAQTSADKFLENSAMNLMAKELAQNHTEILSLVGKEFGTYKIERAIGAGGMGEVYLAHDDKLNRKVALKILPAEFLADAERIKRFEREAQMVSALNHPYIVTIYDVGSADGVNYIATEFVEGETVRDLINRGVNLKQTLSIMSQTCEALAAAHKAGIVHRDIKPENIMLRPDGFVKVLDFGLAKLTEHTEFQQSHSNYTMKGIIIGTPAYMSPAQVSDDKVDHRTDLWSVSVVLYEMLTGINPFKGESRQATFQKILSEEPPLVSELSGKLSVELDQILKKALEKDADVSYQTASDLRADLKRVRREIDSSPSLRSASEARKESADKTRTNYLPIAAGAIALILIGFGVWFFFKQSKSEKSVEAVEWAQAKHAQLTDSYETESYPSLSPDGKDFIYTSQNGDNNDIFRQRIGGKNPTNLTAYSPAADWMGTFSPDGKFIAFRSERKPGGIYLMEETGENVRRVSDTGFHPSWSPDGKQIVVSDKSSDVATSHTIPNSSLWIIDVETGNKKPLDTKGDAVQPNWSPNGKRITYWFIEEGKLGEIATIPAGGGEPVVIARDAAMDWNPVWSPDGKYVYFGSDRGGHMNIWRVAVDEETGAVSAEPEAVSTPSTFVRHLSFSRDGKTLAYIRYETQSNLQSVAFDPEKLKTVGEVNMITRGNRQVSTPALSPNGENYVLRYPSLTQEDIAIFSRDGSNLRYLTNDKFRDRTPRWSPDGKRIAFASDRSGKYQIWMINADGSDLRQITFSEKTGAVAPIFSPDGLRIAFSEIDGKNQAPFILDLRQSWQEQMPAPLPPLPNYKGSYSARDWSAAGNKLLLSLYEAENSENGISVFNFKTSTYEKMIDSGSYPIWLKDNRHFIFEKQNTIFAFDTQTKKTTEIYKPLSYAIQHANVSPDNRLIYFRYLQVDANVWLLDASQGQ
ncbi:MAG: serine/threonine-protein kinase [Acidobacteriota bacterium]|nr:serine/threonine-protein kinase [Acidobacteriota bacterium]